MILKENKIFEIIETNPNKNRIKLAVEYYKTLNMHVNGVGASEHLESIKNYENLDQKKVRGQLAESNKGLFSSLLHPVQKVFSAKGGSRLYNLPTRNQKDFKIKLSNIANGISVKKWIEKKLMNKYITDPNGVIFIEVADNEAMATFKGITSIYDYQSIGQSVEYIVFNPYTLEDNKDVEFFRVVDDSFDYLVKRIKGKEKNSYSIIYKETYKNHFGKVPAFVVSDIFHNTEPIQASFIDETLEKASKYFFDNSINTVHKLLHGFAKYWEFGRDCMNCNGTGIVDGEEGSIACPVCKGTGDRPNGDVSDKLIVPYPNGDEKVITKYSGFESPDIAIWKQYKEDIKDHEKDLVRMLWNTNYADDTKSETATGRFLDVQPINEKLNTISDNFENIERFIIDMFGVFYYEHAYQSCSINYGRRYLVESPDAILDKLTKAIQNKLPITILVDIQKEYIESRYQNNELETSIQLKLLEIEPFLFMTIEQVKGLGIGENDIKKKIYYQEWLVNKSEAELLLKNKDVLKKELDKFITNKEFTTPQNQE